MNALIDHRTFASAYRQLRPVERVFVDAVVTEMEQSAARNNERISAALYRPLDIPDERGMLEKPMVRAAIAERVNEIAAANELSVRRVIKEYMAIAFSSIGDYMHVDEFGEVIYDLTRCTPEQLSAIKSIRIEEPPQGMELGNKQRKCSIVLHDKLIGLQKLAEFAGMLDPDNPHWRTGGLRPEPLTQDTTETAAADAYAALLGN